MDALRHADEILAALWRRHPECVLPGHVGSPMDDRITVTLPRALIEACEPGAVDLSDGQEPAVVDAEMRRALDGVPERTLDGMPERALRAG